MKIHFFNFHRHLKRKKKQKKKERNNVTSNYNYHSRSLTCALFQFLPYSSVTTVTSLSPLLPPTQRVRLHKLTKLPSLFPWSPHNIAVNFLKPKDILGHFTSSFLTSFHITSLCNKSESLTPNQISQNSFETLNSSSRFLFFHFFS